jgi:hypothetical protein
MGAIQIAELYGQTIEIRQQVPHFWRRTGTAGARISNRLGPKERDAGVSLSADWQPFCKSQLVETSSPMGGLSGSSNNDHHAGIER